jgi:hypothetical protein
MQVDSVKNISVFLGKITVKKALQNFNLAVHYQVHMQDQL